MSATVTVVAAAVQEVRLPASDSVWPHLDELVDEVISPGRYRSSMDALFVRLFPDLHPFTTAYYRDEGPPLKELLPAFVVRQIGEQIEGYLRETYPGRLLP